MIDSRETRLYKQINAMRIELEQLRTQIVITSKYLDELYIALKMIGEKKWISKKRL